MSLTWLRFVSRQTARKVCNIRECWIYNESHNSNDSREQLFLWVEDRFLEKCCIFSISEWYGVLEPLAFCERNLLMKVWASCGCVIVRYPFGCSVMNHPIIRLEELRFLTVYLCDSSFSRFWYIVGESVATLKSSMVTHNMMRFTSRLLTYTNFSAARRLYPCDSRCVWTQSVKILVPCGMP